MTLICFVYVCTARAVSAYQDGVGVLFLFIIELGVWRCLFFDGYQTSPHAFIVWSNLMLNSEDL